jgi:hypothetical protein
VAFAVSALSTKEGRELRPTRKALSNYRSYYFWILGR